ncbi:MAG: MarR family transcriptional regulator [Syntrophomonadaceae bacterium]
MSNLNKVVDDFMGLLSYMRTYYFRPAEHFTRMRFGHIHMHALSFIAKRGSCTMRELAAELMVSKQQLTQLVDRMVDAGQVVRKPDENDRRLVRIELSDKGRSMFKEMGAGLKNNFREKLSQIPDSELDELEDMLPRILKILEKANGGRPGCQEKS